MKLLDNPNTVVDFLVASEDDFLKIWKTQIMISPEDTLQDKIIENGYLMYKFIIQSIRVGVSEEELERIAEKVAIEHVEANVNIGNYVHNVNIGRSIIVKYVYQFNASIEEIQPLIDLINDQFDLFCYHTVTKYTELKDQEIKEKSLYIRQSHKDRLTILGQMSSCFVHEFRNPLTSIMGFVKLLQIEHPEMKYLDIIDSELHQLNYRITQFLHTSKSDIFIPKELIVVSVHRLIHDILDFVYPSIVDADINILTDINEDLEIKVYKDEINQVLLNIIMNSIDAVRDNDKNERKVCITCKLVDGQIQINISNNGPLIPTQTINTIFEPFYTTKELGTGIGLYVCKNIIEKHNGEISCTSNLEKTTFSINIPLEE